MRSSERFSNPAARSVANAACTCDGGHPTLEDVEEVRLERLGAQRHARDAAVPQERCELGRDGLGVRLDGDLVRTRERDGQRGRAQAGSVNVGVPPPTNTVWTSSASAGRSRSSSTSNASTYGTVLVQAADRRHEVAVPAAMHAERQVHVEVTGSGHSSRCARKAVASRFGAFSTQASSTSSWTSPGSASGSATSTIGQLS